MNFESYLQSKKIDPEAFCATEPDVFDAWKIEFEQLSPASFTAQKLYLINPVRRLYHLKAEIKPEVIPQTIPAVTGEQVKSEETRIVSKQPEAPISPSKPVVPRPVFKPKPKTN